MITITLPKRKKQLRKYKKKEKKAVRDDLDDEQKEHLKIGQRYRKRKQKYRAAKT